MKITKKIRNLPEPNRKIILFSKENKALKRFIFWTTLTAITLIFIFFWIRSAQEKFKNFDLKNAEQELNIPLQ